MSRSFVKNWLGPAVIGLTSTTTWLFLLGSSLRGFLAVLIVSLVSVSVGFVDGALSRDGAS